MRIITSIIIVFSCLVVIAFMQSYFAKEKTAKELTGKEIFTTVKGPHGACNTCHPNGKSAGRWDTEYEEISDEGDKPIPSLIKISERKTPEQIEKAVRLIIKKHKIPVKEDQVDKLVDYVLKF